MCVPVEYLSRDDGAQRHSEAAGGCGNHEPVVPAVAFDDANTDIKTQEEGYECDGENRQLYRQQGRSATLWGRIVGGRPGGDDVGGWVVHLGLGDRG